MTGPEIEALASPPTSTPWVPLWPVAPTTLGELAYAQGTSGVSIASTNEAVPTTVLTLPAVTLDGATPVLFEFYGFVDVPASVTDRVYIHIYEGATMVGRLGRVDGTAAASGLLTFSGRYRFTPAAGAHTYKVTASRSTQAVSISGGPAGNGGYVPMYARITLAAPISNAPAGALLPVQYGTSLPGSPVDGQEAILVDSLTAPTYTWRFRYHAASTSAYKWEFVGGAPWSVFETTLIGPIAGHPGYTALGPGLTVPRAGEYLLSFTGYYYGLAGSVNTHRWLQDGGDPGVWVDSQVSGTGKGNLTDTKKLEIGAGVQILNGLGVASGDLSSLDRTLTVTPARVA